MVDPRVARQQIDLRLERLRGQSYSQLSILPPFAVDDIPFGSEVWSLTTYRDHEKEGLRIVVQIGPPQPKYLLLHVQADGFRIAQDGTISPLSERELYEFM